MLLTPSQKLFNFKKMVLCSKLLWCKWPDLQNLYQANTEGFLWNDMQGFTRQSAAPHPIPSPVHPIQQRSITKDFLQPQVAMYICMSWQPEKLQNKSSIQTEAVWNISINRSFPKVVRMFAKSSKITTMHHDAACGHLSHPSMVAQWCVCHLVSDSRSNTSFCAATKSAFFSFGSIRPLVFPLWTVGLSHQQIFEYVGDFHQRRSENLNAKTQVKNLQAIVLQIWIVSKIQADGTR